MLNSIVNIKNFIFKVQINENEKHFYIDDKKEFSLILTIFENNKIIDFYENYKFQ